MNISVYDTTFQGSTTGSVTQGGLQVNSFSFPKMIVENCIFDHLRYNDVAFAQMAALMHYPAALQIQIKPFDFWALMQTLNTGPVDYYGYHIYILNCTFSDNFRAVVINSEALMLNILRIQIKDQHLVTIKS